MHADVVSATLWWREHVEDVDVDGRNADTYLRIMCELNFIESGQIGRNPWTLRCTSGSINLESILSGWLTTKFSTYISLQWASYLVLSHFRQIVL